MKNLSKHLSDPRKTPQSQPIPGRETEMVKNPAGGYVFQAGDWERFDRFLIIGTEGGTYYASEKNLTRDNAAVVLRCLAADPSRVLARASEVSDQGLAPKNDAAILALALAFSISDGKHQPLRPWALQKICRTGTHLFQFLEAVRGMRGGGRALNGAVRAWINERPLEELALQMVKYRNRAGWTWKDVFRRFRPKPPTVHIEADEDASARRALYAWIARKIADVSKPIDIANLPAVVLAYENVNRVPLELLPLAIRQTRVPWECVPSEHTTNPDVLEALFESMPMGATVRQLSKLQAYGVLPKRRSDAIARITNPEQIFKARIHPVALLVAAGAYELGVSRNLGWTPDPLIVDALDDAFHIALKTAEPTGKKILVAIDTSGSMRGPSSCNEIPLFKLAAAMAMTYVRTDAAQVIAFDMESGVSNRPSSVVAGTSDLPLSPRQRIVDVVRAIDALRRGGGTDCSLPFRYALEKKLHVDAFVVFTDGETWAGNQHPAQALAEYRAKVNQRAKVVWCAMTAGASACGDPNDTRMLSLVGFDASAPQIVAGFVGDKF